MLSLVLALSLHTVINTSPISLQQPVAKQSSLAAMSSHSAGQTERTFPVSLYLPTDPPPPGRAIAINRNLKYLLAQRTTNYYHASPSQQKNIQLVAQRLNGIVVRPGEVFSYNRRLGPYTQQNGYHWGRAFSGDRIVPSMGGGVCQGASTLYSALLRTGLPIVERHNHSLLVPYLPAGEDATVSMSSGMDFRFKNNHSSPILITAQAYPKERLLTVALWGAQPPKVVSVHHKVLAYYTHKTIRKHTAHDDDDDDETVVAPGQDGGKVSTWLEIKTDRGNQKKYVGTDTYYPSPRIIAVGSDD
ncbi:VanW family protein [Alicyclobacillus dauci]|uniref:VanW family protein n=1 Tax=Alicyclobacillus dauci TaxID=1475485 RepID=A0ABY6Z0P6_9BACL|nr:VanW family protein [Alicyclobacillus dauci]WAH36292.1 VanW family protein [Alicyclobacillus dauci]